MRLKTFLAFSAIVLFVASPQMVAAQTFSECGCDKFLGDALILRKQSVSLDARDEAYFRFFCSVDESTAIETANRHLDLGAFIPDVLKLNLGAGDKRRALREWRSEECSLENRKVSDQELVTLFQEIGNESVLDAANQCYAACQGEGGLYCRLVSVDSSNAVFHAHWTPKSDPPVYPRVTGANIIGGDLVSASIGTLQPIRENMEVTVAGISAALVRDNVAKPLTVRLQTDTAGACDPTLNPVDAAYTLRFSVTGRGKKEKEIRQDSGLMHHANDGSCTERNKRRSVPICLGSGAIATGFSGPHYHSVNNGGASIELGQPKPDCATMKMVYSDSGRGPLGDCKGNGWVRASFTVIGKRAEPWVAPEYTTTEDVAVQAGQGSQVIVAYPQTSLTGVFDMAWDYTIDIEGLSAGQTLQTTTIGTQSPENGRFKSSIGPNGQVVVEIKPQ